MVDENPDVLAHNPMHIRTMPLVVLLNVLGSCVTGGLKDSFALSLDVMLDFFSAKDILK